MRSVQLNLWQNLATTTPGALQVLSGQVEDLAEVSQEVDGTNRLTKATPSDMTCKVLDPTGAIWTFIQNSIGNIGIWQPNTLYAFGTMVRNGSSNVYQVASPGTSASSGGPTGTGTGITDGTVTWNYLATPSTGLLPPWLELYVGGVRVFLGTADLSRVQNIKSGGDYSIEIGAVDWSMQLATSYLGSPTALPWQPSTPYGMGSTCLNGGNTYAAVEPAAWTVSTYYPVNSVVPAANGMVYQCIAAGTSASSGSGPTGTGSSIVDGTGSLRWKYTSPVSSSYGGPAGALPALDGTVTWVYQPPPWQRPVPSAANNASATSATGAIKPWDANGSMESNLAFFADPAGWIYTGAVLQMTSAPILYLTKNYGTVLSPAYITSSSQLPSASYFPIGLIVQLSDGAGGNGSQVQVNSGGTAWVSVYSTTPPPGVYAKVVSYQDQLTTPAFTSLVNPPMMQVQFASSPWPVLPSQPPILLFSGGNYTFVNAACAGMSATFTLATPTAQDLDYWTVMVAVPQNPTTPCYSLVLNSVAGIVVGDSIQIVDSDQSASWTVAGVDPILSQVTTIETVSNVPLGAHIYWTTESQNEMVMVDPRIILPKAILPFGCDQTKFTAPTTADPLFGFLPLRPVNGNDLFPIGDIEPTLTQIKVETGATWINPATGAAIPSYSWIGTPDVGWTGPTSTAPAAPNSDWTCQLAAAPSSLMPYEVCSPSVDSPYALLNPWQRLRNRAYADTTYRRENNGLIILVVSGTSSYVVNGAYVETTTSGGTPVYTYVQNGTTYTSTNVNDVFSPWSPTGADLAGVLAVYDYTQMRRLVFNGSAVTVKAWGGSSWGSPSSYSWPNSGYVQSAVPMIGTSGAIVAYVVDATTGTTINNSLWPRTLSKANDRIEVWGLSGGLLNSAFCYVPTILQGGTLVTTPYGVYLVGANAIAQVTFASGTITLNTINLLSEVDWLFANTLVARTSTEIVIFGRSDVGTTTTTTETWMLRISVPFLSVLDASVLWSEKVSEGCPALIGAIRDPSKAGRIVGHLGGSLFQVDTVRPYCLERFTPGGMTGMELVEHICQLFNALAVPDPNGTMHIVSRVQSDSPTALPVNQVSVKSTRNWKDFAGIVRIESQDSKFCFDAYGQQGGPLLEVSQHPLCWSMSSCAAMAESLVSWFGVPRQISEEEWFYTDPSTAAPWEALSIFQQLTVNGGPNVRLLKLSQNFIKGTATVKTVSA